MGKITLAQAAQWCGGQIDPKYKDVTFFGANNDTRKLEPGQLFVVLQGARDGHDFIPAALERGAAAVLCSRCTGDYPAIVVPDTRQALGEIARQERIRLEVKVVGITGSVGKTTTKEMVAAVLEQKYRVHKTPVNHNNDIGMPMAILAMPEDTQIAVLEMGMNHFREIAYLSNIAKPDVSVIVNIGTMHIEHLGSMEGILKAKLEILEGMDPSGKIILNGDDRLLWNQHPELPGAIYFGVHNTHSAVQAESLQQGDGTLRFYVHSKAGDFSVKLPLDGKHYALDALAAITVGLEFEITPNEICDSLASFRNAVGRQEIVQKGDYTLILDCYNAGPESMAAALAVLQGKTGRRVAVLGDMLELGSCTQAEHYKVGRLAASHSDMLFAYGPNSDRVQSGAVTGGMSKRCVHAFTDRNKLCEALVNQAKPGDVLLFKGSRGMRMELVAEHFLSTIEATEENK